MRTYQMDYGWSIAVPEDWTAAYDKEAGAFVFYPEGSAMTLYFTSYHGEKQGRLAPAELMEAAYLQSIPSGAVPFDTSTLRLEGFSAKGFTFTEQKDGKKTFIRLVGYYGPGELLSVGIYGRSEEECAQAVEMLSGIQRC